MQVSHQVYCSTPVPKYDPYSMAYQGYQAQHSDHAATMQHPQPRMTINHELVHMLGCFQEADEQGRGDRTPRLSHTTTVQ